MLNEENLPVGSLTPADWNPNEMVDSMRDRLRGSLDRFGLVLPLVVRSIGENVYEVISGNQRLEVLLEAGYEAVPCIVVDANDTEARLLSQALNNIHGHDDLGMKAELVREVLRVLPLSDVLKVLPESADSLRDLSSLGQSDMAASLNAWERARAVRLSHMTFQMSSEQVNVVETALEKISPYSEGGSDNPNRRGNALYHLCRDYLKYTAGESDE